MKNNKKIIIFILIIFISIGFAYLSTNLEIDGMAGVKKNNWKIYFDNVEVYKGASLATTTPTTTGTDTTDLEYSVTLTKPGDIYKFYVDIVNAGSLDAMVNVVKKTDLTDAQKKYLNYTVTYADETPISELDLLVKKNGDNPTKDTIVVTVEYKKDVAEEDLPENDITVTEKLHLDYRQANTTAVTRTTSKPKITFNWNYNLIKNGDFSEGASYWEKINNGATFEADTTNKYNGKNSLHVNTTTTSYAGIRNVPDSSTYPYEPGHDYLLHGCFYKDSTDVNGGVNQSLRMFFVYEDDNSVYKYIGISTGDDKLKNGLIEKQWVCYDKIVNYPTLTSGTTTSALSINNSNHGLTNNYWVSDVRMNIVEQQEYTYKSTITSLPEISRDGYTFDGWYTDPYGGTQITTSTKVRESTTYYAHWSSG